MPQASTALQIASLSHQMQQAIEFLSQENKHLFAIIAATNN